MMLVCAFVYLLVCCSYVVRFVLLSCCSVVVCVCCCCAIMQCCVLLVYSGCVSLCMCDFGCGISLSLRMCCWCSFDG